MNNVFYIQSKISNGFIIFLGSKHARHTKVSRKHINEKYSLNKKSSY